MTDYALSNYTVDIEWADGSPARKRLLEGAHTVRLTDAGLLSVGYEHDLWRVLSPSSWRSIVIAARPGV